MRVADLLNLLSTLKIPVIDCRLAAEYG